LRTPLPRMTAPGPNGFDDLVDKREELTSLLREEVWQLQTDSADFNRPPPQTGLAAFAEFEGRVVPTYLQQDQRLSVSAAGEPSAAEPPAAAGPLAPVKAFFASFSQPRTAADGAKEVLQRIKDAGVAGVVSVGLVQTAFWAASVPICLVVYSLVTGHWPNPTDGEDMAKFGAEAFAYVNLARFAAPLRMGVAFAAVPWVQTNIIDKLQLEFSVGGRSFSVSRDAPALSSEDAAKAAWLAKLDTPSWGNGAQPATAPERTDPLAALPLPADIAASAAVVLASAALVTVSITAADQLVEAFIDANLGS